MIMGMNEQYPTYRQVMGVKPSLIRPLSVESVLPIASIEVLSALIRAPSVIAHGGSIMRTCYSPVIILRLHRSRMRSRRSLGPGA